MTGAGDGDHQCRGRETYYSLEAAAELPVVMLLVLLWLPGLGLDMRFCWEK
jgi:hypothetical protein